MSKYGLALLPLAAVTVFMGVWPQPAINLVNEDVKQWLVPLHAQVEIQRKKAEEVGAVEAPGDAVPGDDEKEEK
jgi:hypothetical protein